jgi:hypothetical protein
MPVLPATKEVEYGGSRFKVSLGKELVRHHLNQQAGCGGTHLWFQLFRRHRLEDHLLRLALGENTITYSKINYGGKKKKRLGVWLKW